MNTNTYKKRKLILLLISLVLSLAVLGSVVGVSIAYVKGRVTDDTESGNPYVAGSLYYSGQKLTQNSISGAISSTGVVTLNVNSTSVSQTNNTFDLPLTIKNEGNIKVDVYSITAVIKFYEDVGGVETLSSMASNQSGATTYYLTLTPSGSYVIADNAFFDVGSTQIEAGSSSQFLTSLTIDNTNIVNSNLLNKTFKIYFIVEIGQEGLEEII